MPKMFVNLHVHSQYSLLDSCLRMEDLVVRNKAITEEFNQKHNENHTIHSCITDHGNLYATMFHYNLCKNYNIHQIIGEEFYVTDDALNKDKEHYKDHPNEHMIILAKDYEGYKQISKLSSLGFTKGFYYRPRIDDSMLEEIGTDHLIATSACVAGRIPRCILKDDIEEAKKWIAYYDKLFNHNFYLEIQPTVIKQQGIVNEVLLQLSQEMGIPTVATTDAHYINKTFKEAHDVLLCMQSKDVMSNPDRWTYEGNTYYIMTKDEIIKAFQDFHGDLNQKLVLDAIERTEDIASQCNVELKTLNHYLPSAEIPQDDEAYNYWKEQIKSDKKDKTQYLEYEFLNGLVQKWCLTKSDRIRALHELKTIEEMGFETYFILYREIIDFVRNKAKIPCGSGRGCLVGDCNVLTNHGFKQIKDIQIGNLVFAKNEKLYPVDNKYIYNVNEDLVSLSTNDNIIKGITKDHKVLAIKQKDFDNGIRIPIWIEANKLEEGDILCEVE